MAKKIYVGNLSFQTTEADLSDMFSKLGQVESVQIITDRDTGRSKGFGFVQMSDDAAAAKAIGEFNGKEVNGRQLTVKLKPDRWKRKTLAAVGVGTDIEFRIVFHLIEQVGGSSQIRLPSVVA